LQGQFFERLSVRFATAPPALSKEVGDKLRLAVEDRLHVMPSYYRYWEGLDPRLKLRGGEVRPPAAVPVKPDRLKQGATSPQRALAGCIF
jgi:hypothetical protein